MRNGQVSRRLLLVSSIGASALTASCLTPVSKGYEIHTGDLSCDEANRLVYAALRDMRMEITAFKPAKPGQAGQVSAMRKDGTNPLAGDVAIQCDGGRVDIEANQRGDLLGDKQFELGVFLAVTGRADLEVVRDGRDATGDVRRRTVELPSTPNPSTNTGSTGTSASQSHAGATAASASLDVQMEALRGYASVLDFDADLGAGGVLPVRVSIHNATRRAYDFDASNIVLNVAGQRERVQPLSPTEAYSRLASAGSDPSLGDLSAAKSLLAQKAVGSGRLAPGGKFEGFVYFPLGDYDRARLSITDTATGESEAFVVDF